MQRKLLLDDVPVKEFLGARDAHLRRIQEDFQDVKLVVRGEELVVKGPEEQVALVEEVVRVLKGMLQRQGRLEELDVLRVIQRVRHRNAGTSEGNLVILTPKRRIQPLTPRQATYLQAIERHDVVLSVGPAGTGKTFLAVAMALKYLWEERVERILLTRPAVEAGESLGFLPGDFQEKINPYLTPLYDALQAMIPYEKVQRLMHKRIIEVAPLAYMRGRTLGDAFIILDEAQNTKSVQMKMFLTRLGPRSKVVITGDVTQIDLPAHERSGLVEAISVLRGVPGIAVVELTQDDVIRHPLVRNIIQAYERSSQSNPERS